MPQRIHDLLAAIAPATIGSTTALFYLKGNWARRLSLWALGIGMALTLGDWMAEISGAPATATGLVIGLFGMAIIDKIFDTIEQVDLAAAVHKFMDRIISIFPGRK